jgi:phosphoglycerate dehydrogenase-like enzyme
MRLRIIGDFPQSYYQRVRAEFPDLELATDGRVDAVLSWSRPLADVIEAARQQPDLPWIHTRAAGVSPALADALNGHSTVLTNGSGAQGPAIGEYVAALVLVFYKDLFRLHALQQQGEWASDFALRELRGQRLGIVGLGSLGGSTATVMRGFGVHVRGLRRTGAPAENVDEVFGPAELGAFLDGLDILVIAAPLTEGTRGLIGAAELARLNRGALLVNVGRGQIVDEPAMLEALRSGQLGGAALDVFETEPLPAESPLWRMSNVIVSPHCADSTPQSPERSLEIFLDNLSRFERGQPLLNVVDREQGY